MLYQKVHALAKADSFCYTDTNPHCVPGRLCMFQITLLAMGKLKEKFYLSAAAEYEKRLSGVCRFQLLELPECRLPESPQPAEIAMGLAKEGELIRQKIPSGARRRYYAITPQGREACSRLLAEWEETKEIMDKLLEVEKSL